MILPGLTATDAELMYEAWRAGREHTPKPFEIGPGGREEGDSLLQSLREVTAEVVDTFHERDDAQAMSEFDAEFSIVLHQTLPLPSYVVANDAFWRYLACVELWDLVVWRHSSDAEGERKVGRSHFGLGDRWETMPKRLWLRADIALDDSAEDPYELAPRGGMDFWTSGIVRRLYAGSRPLARALIRFQFPETGTFRGREYRPQTLGTDAIRELYKRLRHFQAFVSFSTMDESDAADLIHSLAQDLRPPT